MPNPNLRLPISRSEFSLSLLLGGGFALALFVVMALVQMIGEVDPPVTDLIEEIVAYTPPDLEKIEDELPPPPEVEEAPPELEVEPPRLSLAQLDLVLNPGTGGSLMGDFSMPTISANAGALGTEDFVDFSDLDQTPKPLPGSKLDFPRRLRRRATSGRIVLLIKISESGEVIDAEVESSSLPDFEDIVVRQVGKWRFTSPTKDGSPVRAQARFPIPIRIGS